MKRDIYLFLEDILENINLIETSTKGMTEKKFGANRDIQDATIRRLEVIGEAVKNIPSDFRNKHPEIEWKKIAGMRDVIIHAYFGINFERVWGVLEKDIGKLKKNVKDILGMGKKK